MRQRNVQNKKLEEASLDAHLWHLWRPSLHFEYHIQTYACMMQLYQDLGVATLCYLRQGGAIVAAYHIEASLLVVHTRNHKRKYPLRPKHLQAFHYRG